jgi:hypothetical protein
LPSNPNTPPPTTLPYPNTPTPRPIRPGQYGYRVGGSPAGSQSGTFSPGGFHQSAKKRGMQGFPPSYPPGSQSSQQPPARRKRR